MYKNKKLIYLMNLTLMSDMLLIIIVEVTIFMVLFSLEILLADRVNKIMQILDKDLMILKINSEMNKGIMIKQSNRV